MARTTFVKFQLGDLVGVKDSDSHRKGLVLMRVRGLFVNYRDETVLYTLSKLPFSRFFSKCNLVYGVGQETVISHQEFLKTKTAQSMTPRTVIQSRKHGVGHTVFRTRGLWNEVSYFADVHTATDTDPSVKQTVVAIDHSTATIIVF